MRLQDKIKTIGLGRSLIHTMQKGSERFEANFKR